MVPFPIKKIIVLALSSVHSGCAGRFWVILDIRRPLLPKIESIEKAAFFSPFFRTSLC
jgi:hypothetical protein